MTVKSLLSNLILIFFFFLVDAQTIQEQRDSILAQIDNTDSEQIVSLYDSVSRLYWRTNPDSSLYYAEIALKYAQKSRNNLSIAEAYNSLGNAYAEMGKNDEALDSYEKSLSLRTTAGDKLKASYSLSNMGIAYINQKKYSEAINAYKMAATICNEFNQYSDEASMHMGVAQVYKTINNNTNALEYAIKAASLFIHVNDSIGLAYTYNFIGSLHQELNNNTLALEYFKKSNQFYQELNIHWGIATTINRLGIVYSDLGQIEKALACYEEFLQISIDHDDVGSQGTAYNNIGFIYAKTKQYEKALETYSKSLTNSLKTNDSLNLMNTYNNIASVYYSMGDLDRAEKFVNIAFRYTPQEKNLLFIAENHDIFSKIYAAKNNFKKAFYHQSINQEIKDSLFSMKSNEQVVEMQVRFETERKEKEIELLKKNDEIRSLEFQRQKNANLLWIGLTILLIGVGVLGYINLQQKKNSNILLQGKNEQLEIANKKLIESEKHLTELNATKDRFFTIIAHDLKNPFNALLGFSELLHNNFAKYRKEQTEQIIKTIFDTSHKLFKLLENLLEWSKSQTGRITYTPELFPLNKKVKQEMELLNNLSEKKNLKIINRVEESVVVYADVNLVSIIIRNLLNNAIKFSNPGGKITITAVEEDNMVAVKVTDTGIGMSEQNIAKLFRLDESFSSRGTANEEGTGLGLIISKEFIEKNGGKIYVSSQKEAGSTFSFTLPTSKSGINA